MNRNCRHLRSKRKGLEVSQRRGGPGHLDFQKSKTGTLEFSTMWHIRHGKNPRGEKRTQMRTITPCILRRKMSPMVTIVTVQTPWPTSFRFRRDSCEDLVSRPASGEFEGLAIDERRVRKESINPLPPMIFLFSRSRDSLFLSTIRCLLNFFQPSWWLMFTAKSNCEPV